MLWAGGGRAQMVALDASSGKVVWQTPLGTEPGSSIWSSPAYYKGSIYVGLASFQGCPQEFGRDRSTQRGDRSTPSSSQLQVDCASQVPRAGCMVIARRRPGGRRRLHRHLERHLQLAVPRRHRQAECLRPCTSPRSGRFRHHSIRRTRISAPAPCSLAQTSEA